MEKERRFAHVSRLITSARTSITCPCAHLCWKKSLLSGLPLGQAKGQAGRICRCRRMVRELLAACRQQPDQPVYPYLLGVLLERVGQWPLTSRPRWAYDQAEGYYDRARQLQQRQPPGTYDRQHYLRPSVALLRLSLRRRQEERFYDWWDRCGGLRRFHRDVQALFQVRWLIVRKTMNGRPLPSGICMDWPAGIALFQLPRPESYQISSRRPVRGRGRYSREPMARMSARPCGTPFFLPGRDK